MTPQEVVAERIAADLQKSHHRSLRKIRVFVDREIVVLSGTVPSYYDRQLAQKIAHDFTSRFAMAINVV